MNKSNLRDLETALAGTGDDPRFKQLRDNLSSINELDGLKLGLHDQWWLHYGENPSSMQKTISNIQGALRLGQITVLSGNELMILHQILGKVLATKA